MPIWLVLPSSFAAGSAPEDRVEVSAETGVVTNEGAIGFGLGAGLRRGPLAVVGTAGFGGRTNFADRPSDPGYGLGSLAVALDGDAGAMRVGLVLLTDLVVLPTAEQGCDRLVGCRHEWFVGLETPPELGIGASPAGGLRVSGTGASGSAFALSMGLQPSIIEEELYWYLPRFDLAVWSTRNRVSIHAWGGRYGLAVGFGYRISRPPG